MGLVALNVVVEEYLVLDSWHGKHDVFQTTHFLSCIGVWCLLIFSAGAAAHCVSYGSAGRICVALIRISCWTPSSLLVFWGSVYVYFGVFLLMNYAQHLYLLCSVENTFRLLSTVGALNTAVVQLLQYYTCSCIIINIFRFTAVSQRVLSYYSQCLVLFSAQVMKKNDAVVTAGPCSFSFYCNIQYFVLHGLDYSRHETLASSFALVYSNATSVFWRGLQRYSSVFLSNTVRPRC